MKKILFIFVSTLVFSSCATSYQEKIENKEEKAFIKMSGNCHGLILDIDDSTKIKMAENCNKKLYEISPGNHTIKVYKADKMLVNKTLLMSNRTTEEVVVP
ncbi:hypothetical protein JXR93_02815 [bacterium]|nr:hypothetical protein [bacterium]